MTLNYAKLTAQGRVKSFGNPWSAEELEALLLLETERQIQRTVAADYIRNGILTLEDYDKAVKVDFKPVSAEEAKINAESELSEAGQKAIAKVKKAKKEK